MDMDGSSSPSSGAALPRAAPLPALEELLRHASWARALARRLVADDQRADDVVQQAWLAAVEKPPAAGPGLRGWLAQLIRNLAHNQRRAESRRDRHERAAASAESSVPAADALAAEFAAQRLIADALLRLDEPYRETLLRRWYRDEKPAAIAAAMDVPVRSVETRLARGLERLRAEVASGHATARVDRDDGRIDWRRALLPLVIAAPRDAAVAGAAATLAAGITAMTTTKLATAAAAAAAIGAAIWIGVSDAGPESKGPVPIAVAPPPAAVDSDGAGSPPAGGLVVRAEESATSTTTADPSPKEDRLEPWRKNGRLHGRVLASDTRQPIAGASVRVMIPKFVFGPDLDQATTDANGEFRLERLSEEVRLIVRADGHLGLDRFFGAKELAAPADAPATEFLLEPRQFATLVCRLVSKADIPIPAQVLREATVIVGPKRPDPDSVERFQGLWTETAGKMRVPFESQGDGVFRCESVPVRVDVHASVSLGASILAGADVEPLTAGETREVVVPISAGIVVTTRLVDATTHAPLTGLDDQTFSDVKLTWTGAPDDAPFERLLLPRAFEGPMGLPGPGRLAVDGRVRGFEPTAFEITVQDGDVVDVPLASLRRLELHVTDARGGPVYLSTWKEYEENATTSVQEPGLGVDLEAHAFAVDAAPPSWITFLNYRRFRDREELRQLDPNRSTLKWEGAEDKVHVWKAGAMELFLPHEARFIAVYADGALAGRVAVGADELTASVTLTLPERRFGALRFRAVESASDRPPDRYDVELVRLGGPSLDAPLGRARVEVHDPKDGLFIRELLPAGRYEVRVLWTPARLQVTPIARWSGRVDVPADGTADLDVVQLVGVGSLEVRVVDAGGAPVPDAELSFRDADDDTPVVALVKLQEPESIRTNRKGLARGINLREGIVRVEARAVGFEPATDEIEIDPSAPNSLTIVLHATPTR
jgi:RNA polymerase sigma-70 factor (ECF subfamily)